VLNIFLQFKDLPHLEILSTANKITITATFPSDWHFPKTDVERFYIEKMKEGFYVSAKAHYGIQTVKKKVNGEIITLRFEGSSHAPVGIFQGHEATPNGYYERGFKLKFHANPPKKIYFGKLKRELQNTKFNFFCQKKWTELNVWRSRKI
jgi:hypothetical protein